MVLFSILFLYKKRNKTFDCHYLYGIHYLSIKIFSLIKLHNNRV